MENNSIFEEEEEITNQDEDLCKDDVKDIVDGVFTII